jgi:hypothetical protein
VSAAKFHFGVTCITNLHRFRTQDQTCSGLCAW